jgi:hypothetical protein
MGGRWDERTESFITEGKDRGTATRFTNETKIFFEDDGRTLWITFMNDSLHWGFLKPQRPERHSDGDSVWRAIADDWKAVDLKGEPLTKDKLSGALTKVIVSKYFLKRNHEMVDATSQLISAPYQGQEVQRSGTWAAATRYAANLGRPLHIVYSQGDIETEAGWARTSRRKRK